MDEIYISQWDALQCFEDWEDSRGRFHWAYEDRTYQRIEELSSADVIPVSWIMKQVDKGKWEELVGDTPMSCESCKI